jgi:hypothetical protein
MKIHEVLPLNVNELETKKVIYHAAEEVSRSTQMIFLKF